MLPKLHRPTTKSVHYLLRKGVRRHGTRLTIIYIRGQRQTRWGVHVAKKVAPLATQRNAAKRAIYTAIVTSGGSQVSDGLFFVIVNKKYASEWKQLIVSPSDISIYNRILDRATSDLKRFLTHLEKY